MILGIGTDIVSVERIERAIEQYGARFADRVFTTDEWEFCKSRAGNAECLAGRFAVKEAAFKALGHGWDECGGFTSVEVVRQPKRRPEIVFHGRAKEIAERISVTRAHVSITHDAGFAAAIVVLE